MSERLIITQRILSKAAFAIEACTALLALLGGLYMLWRGQALDNSSAWLAIGLGSWLCLNLVEGRRNALKSQEA